MAKKNSYRLRYDYPVALTFVLVSLFLLVLDSFVLKGKLISGLFQCNGGKAPENPFSFTSPADYASVVLHSLGNSDWHAFLVNSALVLLLGSVLEERYGSPAVGLMVFISALVSGVLAACFSPFAVCGASCIVFMMIILLSLAEFNKKNLSVLYFALFAFYLALQLVDVKSAAKEGQFLQESIVVFTALAGGISGSLFGFLVAPKKSSPRKKKEEPTVTYEDDAYSKILKKKSQPKESAQSEKSEDSTIIGSISL